MTVLDYKNSHEQQNKDKTKLPKNKPIIRKTSQITKNKDNENSPKQQDQIL